MSKTVTLSSLQTQARQRADMVNSQYVSDSELQGYINASVSELRDLLIQSYGSDYFVSSYDFTTSGNVDTYALPTDFYKLMGVDVQVSSGSGIWYPGREFMFRERNRFQGINFTLGYYGQGFMYRLQGDNIKLAPMPSGHQVVRLWYIPTYTSMTGSADTLDGLNGYEEYVIVDAAIKMLQKEESDVSVLMGQKQALIKRIEVSAHNRDLGDPQRVIDTSRDGFGFGFGMGNLGYGGWGSV